MQDIYNATNPDPCLGYLPGVRNACCGHGVSGAAYIQFDNGIIIRGEFIVEGAELIAIDDNGRMRKAICNSTNGTVSNAYNVIDQFSDDAPPNSLSRCEFDPNRNVYVIPTIKLIGE